MTDELLPYYERGAGILPSGRARVRPEASRRLPAGCECPRTEIDDPHVERLIQAVAFLNARTRRKIDDDFSEISQALLQVLYPHYLAPFPSAAIVRFALPRGSGRVGPGLLDRPWLEPGDGTDRRRALSIPDLLPGNRVAARADEGRRAEGVVSASGRHAGRRMFAPSSGWSSHPTAGRYPIGRDLELRDAGCALLHQCAAAAWRTSCMRRIFNNSLGVVVSGDTDESARTDARSRAAYARWVSSAMKRSWSLRRGPLPAMNC